MKQLTQMLKWELILLQRNQLITISFLIAGLYLGIFYLLKDLGNLENVLIVMIFNDPVITGYLFAAVLMLFEKNQNTLAALFVLPIQFTYYLWSKALALTLVSTLTALVMAWVGHGFQMNYLHFITGVAGSTILFVWIGCVVGYKATSFNHLLLLSIAFLVPIALPFLAFFEVWHHPLLYLVPSYPGILLLKAAFQPITLAAYVYSYGYLLFSLIIVFLWSKKTLEQK